MALSTSSDYIAFLNKLFWFLEVRYALLPGNYNQNGSVEISPWVFDFIRYGYNPQDTSNYGPATDYESSEGLVVQAYPEGISTAESTAMADVLTAVTSYLTYRHTRQGNDTNNVTVAGLNF